MAEEFLPREPVATADWSQEYFYLPEEGADLPGRYDLTYAPYLYGIFVALDDPQIPEVDLMKAAQIGWTFGLIAYLCRRIDGDPCAMVMMFAAEEAAREFIDEKFKPSVLATPTLRDRVDVSSSRKDGNRALFKKFPGGFLKLGGSRSIHKVKSTPAKLVIVEEPDDAKENLKEQGDSITLLWERTKRARRSKRIMGGTPSLKDFSRIERHIQQSDQRVLPVRCHECREIHVLNWDHVIWRESPAHSHPVYGHALPDTAVYACPHCKAEWDDFQRKENIRHTVAAAMHAGDPLCGWTPTAEYHGVAGFMELNELYSCLPGAGVAELVRDYLKAEHLAALGDETEKIVFVNSKLGRPYEFKGDNETAEGLKARALSYPELTVPHGGLLLSAGVDTQDDRLAIVIRAWGRGEESWLLYWGELHAATGVTDVNDPVWAELEQRVFGEFNHAAGFKMRLSALSIDSSDGGSNDAVYHWVRSRAKQHRGALVMAIKGSSERADPEIFVTPAEKSIDHRNPNKRTKADKYGLKVFIVGTNKAKDLLSARQRLTGEGPGRWHAYQDVRADYWEQITAEVKAPHRSLKGRKIWQKKSGLRNEGLDCEVYALHAARARRVHLMTPQRWDALEQQYRQADLFQSAAKQAADSTDLAKLAKALNG